jgi:hypothetical protein
MTREQHPRGQRLSLIIARANSAFVAVRAIGGSPTVLCIKIVFPASVGSALNGARLPLEVIAHTSGALQLRQGVSITPSCAAAVARPGAAAR